MHKGRLTTQQNYVQDYIIFKDYTMDYTYICNTIKLITEDYELLLGDYRILQRKITDCINKIKITDY